MTHIRIDDGSDNSKRAFRCGISPLPSGDRYVYEAEAGLHHMVDCPGCDSVVHRLGTPLSELSGRPGHKGFDEFKRIAESWGYD